MTNTNSRMYANSDDLQRMIDFLAAVRQPGHISDYPGIVDLHEAMVQESIQRATRLWFDSKERMIAFAWVDSYNNLQFEVDFTASDLTLENQIVDWGEACIQRAARSQDNPATLDASCRSDNLQRIAFLERHGFVRQEVQSLHLARDLSLPIEAPVLPQGFSIGHVLGEHEVDALVALHRAAFGSENMTVEERLAMMHVPDYEPELDLLAMAPNGRYAATCFCSISREENERSGQLVGYADPIATHPDFQMRGLAKALLLTGLQELKARGMQIAVTGTSSENIAMQRTALAAGFSIQSRTIWFSK